MTVADWLSLVLLVIGLAIFAILALDLILTAIELHKTRPRKGFRRGRNRE